MKYVLSLCLFCLLLVSCSDDGTSPSSTQFIPTAAGNYWIYSNYILDTNNQAHIMDLYDSLIYDSETTYLNRNASKFNGVFNFNTIDGIRTSSSDIYMYEENNQLYVSESFIEMFMVLLPIKINIQEQWFKLADRNGTTWDLYSIPIDTAQILMGSITLTLNGTVTLKITNNGTKSIELPTGAVNAERYTLLAEFNGTIVGYAIPLKISLSKIDYYFANKIGLVGVLSEPLPIEIMPGFPTIKLEGFKKDLYTYKAN